MPSGRAAVEPDTMRQLTDIKLNNYKFFGSEITYANIMNKSCDFLKFSECTTYV